ncbi:MAG: hypothetical protein HZB76_03240 [Chlamydiae bacterium]|nr:hypothetical protein [Chlamydiota bacterium]
MEFFKTLLKPIFAILLFSMCFAEEAIDKKQVLYLMQSNEINSSFSAYQQMCKSNNVQDFETLQQMALILLSNGAKSKDQEVQRLTIFGSGLAASVKSLEILEQGIISPDLQTQLTSLYFLSLLQDDRTDELLTKACSSDFIQTRLQAAYYMAERKHPFAIGQIEALMHKLPSFARPYFPYLFALINTPDATNFLKQFLADQNIDVRIETILNIARFSKDELLPLIKKRTGQFNIAEQEAVAFALGSLKDSTGIENLKKLSSSTVEGVKTAAFRSLYLLGDLTAAEALKNEALKNNLFAIFALSEVSGVEDFLFSLLSSNNMQTRFNAIYSLLKRKDSRCLPYLREFFITDTADLGFQMGSSQGRALNCIKVFASASQRNEKEFDPAMSLAIKEQLLKDSLELKEVDFLSIAKMIFDNKQNELIPVLCSLLENLKSEKGIEFLKSYAQKAGSPLIRDYSNLALFKLKEKGPYEEYCHNWVERENKKQIMQFNTLTYMKPNKNNGVYQLTSQETSRLLIDMFTALASKQDEKNISVLVNAIKNGNFKNRYLLCGFLIRATE